VTLKNPATADRSFSTAVVAGVLPVRCASRMEQGNGSRTWCRTPRTRTFDDGLRDRDSTLWLALTFLRGGAVG
jgi:hypothetical protein